MADNYIKKDLKVLNLEEIEIKELSIRDVIKAYRKATKKLHPDVSGYDSKEDFQELGGAYERILKILVHRSKTHEERDIKNKDERFEENSGAEDCEERFVRENFHNFNFPTEKEGSFIIKVENDLVDTWDKCFQELYGQPKINKNAKTGTETSRLWKIMYEACELTIHFYKKPKTTKVSKFLVQGGNHMAKYSFVFTELPIIYKTVCNAKPAKIEQDVINVQSPSGVTCDKCKFKSNSMIQMKKHIRTIHNPRRSQGSKRISSFTPVTKPSKKCKNDGTPRSNIFLNAEGIADESMMMILEDHSIGNGSLVTLEERSFVASTTETTIQKTEASEQEVKEQNLFSCPKCEYDTENERDLGVHVNKHDQNPCSCFFELEEDIVLKEHNSGCKAFEIIDDMERSDNVITPSKKKDDSSLQESVVICENCGEWFKNMQNYDQHIRKCHSEVQSIECEVYARKLQTQDELEIHQESQHGCDSFRCNVCEVTSERKSILDEHMKEHTTKPMNSKQKNINCSQCEFICQDNKSFIKHLLDEHSVNSEVMHCPHCDFKSFDIVTLDSHIENNHVELAMLGHITQNQTVLSQKFGTLENLLMKVIDKVLDSHTEIKQEMFILRQNYSAANEKLERMEKTLMSNKTFTNTKVEIESQYKKFTTKPKVPEPKPQKEVSEKVNSILLVGDSIAGNAHLPTLETAVNADVKLVKAYSSTYENTNTVAQSAPRFPHKNFEDVISNEINKSEYDALIIQAGSVDITNLKTEEQNANEYLEYFKQKTIISAHNLFQAAKNAETKHPELKKIILMKQTPRYDADSSNPPGLKPYLSKLFNEKLDELCNSAQTSKITIGNHNLQCHGAVQEARYRNNQTRRFDGVHLYGPSGMKAYTASVLNILSSAQLVVCTPPRYYDQLPHMRCPQAKYQSAQLRVQAKTYRHEKSAGTKHYSVPTQNKFSPLADWVQGNY